MNNMYMRKASVTIGNKKFDSDSFTIDFDVPFNDGKEVNVAEIRIYNLSDQTISSLKKDTPVILNAGYQDNVGAILIGVVKHVQTNWESVDKITEIEVIDNKDQWANVKIKKTYKQGVTGKDILTDLLPLTGLAIGAFELPFNQKYPGGKTFNTKLANAVKTVATDCRAKTHITRGRIFIRGKSSGDNSGFVIDAEHGLIGSPQPIEKEDEDVKTKKKVKRSGWKVVCLLMHGVTTDVRLQIKSKTANGVFRVESGKHDGSSFYTEMEVYPD